MSRATFAPSEWIARARELVRVDGLVLTTMGGAPVDAVVREAWKVDRFNLPISKAGRTSVVTRA